MKYIAQAPLTAYRVVFDNNCPLCVRLAAWGENAGLVPAGHTVAFEDLPQQDRQRVNENRFRHEFALLGPAEEATRYGLEAIGKVMSFKHRFFAQLKPGNWLFAVIRPLYHAFANNRYLAVPKERSKFKCDCEPPFSMKWRVLFAVFSNLLAILAALGVALALAAHAPEAPARAALRFFIVTAPGWLLLLAVAFPLLGRERWGDYLVHLSIIHLLGVACLLPVVLLVALPDAWFYAAFWMCVGFSFTTMLRAHYKRMIAVGKPLPLTLLWVLVLNAVAIFLLLNINIILPC